MKAKLIIPGGSGFLGKALERYFHHQGYEIVILTRGRGHLRNGTRFRQWDGKSVGPWAEEIEGAKAVINLAGRSVNCRYTEKNQREIYDSRVDSTGILGEVIANAKLPPQVWINASTATIYRHSEDKEMSEWGGELGTGLSVDVARNWEATLWQAPTHEVRKIALRTSLVLARNGGALPPLMHLARAGLGGPLGSGDQYVSWIHRQDFIRAVEFLLESSTSEGAYNLTAPFPLPNANFMATLRQQLKVPVGLPNPEWLLELGAKLIGTETELVLKSRRVIPDRLLEEGFEFEYPTLELALEQLIPR